MRPTGWILLVAALGYGACAVPPTTIAAPPGLLSPAGDAPGIDQGHYHDTLRFRTAAGHDALVCFDFTAVPHIIE